MYFWMRIPEKFEKWKGSLWFSINSAIKYLTLIKISHTIRSHSISSRKDLKLQYFAKQHNYAMKLATDSPAHCTCIVEFNPWSLMGQNRN